MTTMPTKNLGLLLISLSTLIVSVFSASHAKHTTTRKFIHCIKNQEPNIMKHLYTPTSLTYTHLLGNSTQNPRWFNFTSQRPSFIVAPRSEPDIRPVILCSRRLGLQVRVKSGGHDYEGLSFRSPSSRFIMIDLSSLNRTDVDLNSETIWIQTGVKLGQLYYDIAAKTRTHAFPAGLYPTVGSGGHISGGGIGMMTRKHGLASDNVLDARFMDVCGNILDRESMGEDLFWALRGGGGASFGVILAWKLRLVRVPEKVTAFTFRRKLDPRNLSLIQKWQKTAHNVSDDLFIRVLLMPTWTNDSAKEKLVQVNFNGLFLGPADELVPLMYEIFPEFELRVEDCFSPPVGNSSCADKPCVRKECFEVPWIKSVLYFCGKKLDNPNEILLEKKVNTKGYSKGSSDFLQEPIPDKGWKMINKVLLREDKSTIIIIDPLGGKMDEISEDETPFAHRKGVLFNVQYLTYWSDNSKKESREHVKWLRYLRKKMTPYVTKCPRTAYINYKDLGLGRNDGNYSYEGARVWGEKYFKGNFERLATVKGLFDPNNFFRNEQSIPVLL